jgi:putative transposase
MIDYTSKLLPGNTYHIYNRANGKEELFSMNENYKYFLDKYKRYIVPIADTYCYCLMPNHFHFLIRFKTEKELTMLNETSIENYPKFFSEKFRRFLNSYSKAFNKQKGRRGSLFMHPFKRKEIGDVKYFRKIVHYIHCNPVAAELCKAPYDWKYSSFNAIVRSKNSLLKREDVINLFDDVENFIFVHQNPPELTGVNAFLSENF